MKIRRYSELKKLRTMEDRYEYLRLDGTVGQSTFGFDRYVNQKFYTSMEWRMTRQKVILRDNACDLGIDGFDLGYRPLVHHMNPLTVEDIDRGGEAALDPEFLITVSSRTHNAIHFGDVGLLPAPPAVRQPGDTTPWKAVAS